MTSAPDILAQADAEMTARTVVYDIADVRSMARAVAAFNALSGLALTEMQGWAFMAVLKLARAQATPDHLDSYVDGAAYIALAGEAGVRGPAA